MNLLFFFKDLLMCAEISHKIMRAETVYDIIVRVRNESRDDFRKALEKTLLGSTVLTDYNNRTYRIDDIRYDLCPTDTFPTKDGEISYVDYYKVSKPTTHSLQTLHASIHLCSMFAEIQQNDQRLETTFVDLEFKRKRHPWWTGR